MFLQLVATVFLTVAAGVVAEENFARIGTFSVQQPDPESEILSISGRIFVRLDEDATPRISHSNHVSWNHGTTRIDAEIEWSARSGSRWRRSQLTFSTQPCNSPNVAETINIYPGFLGGGGSAQSFRFGLGSPVLESAGRFGSTRVTYRELERNLVISMDRVGCVYVRVGQDPRIVAQAPVMRSAPSFPSTFYAGIEATKTEGGYSRYSYEAFDEPCQAIAFGFHRENVGFRRVVADLRNKMVWHVDAPSAEFPNGRCTSAPQTEGPGSEIIATSPDGNLVSSGRLLGFFKASGTAATFVPNGAERVRGVPVDQWRYRMSRRLANGDEGFFTAHMFFSTPEWHFGRSNGYRVLQRVELTGHEENITNFNSLPVDDTFDYIDFRPFIPPWVSFEPCEMLPRGDGCECLNLQCPTTRPRRPRNATAGTPQPPTAAPVDVLSSTSASSEGSSGRSRTRARDLALAWLLGLVVGAVLATALSSLIRCIRARRQRKEVYGVDLPVPTPPTFGAFAPSYYSAGVEAVDHQ